MTELLQAREKNDDVVQRIEELVGKNGKKADLVREAVHAHVNDPSIWEEKIKETEKERDRLMEEKQRIELELERQRDKLTDLKDRKTEARTLRKVEKQIPASRYDRIADIVREHKYDSDPRSMTESQVIQKHAEMIADENGFEVEMVEKILRIRVNA